MTLATKMHLPGARADMNNHGDRRPKRQVAIPPPRATSATSQGEVPFSADDLSTISDAADLEIVIADGRLLADAVSRISDAMHEYVLWARVDEQQPQQGEMLSWADALKVWVADGAVLLGGGGRRASRAGIDAHSDFDSALRHLLECWPDRNLAAWETDDGLRHRRWIALQSMLRDAGALRADLPDPRQGWADEDLAAHAGLGSRYEATRDLLRSMLSGLGALSLMLAGAKDYTQKLPKRRLRKAARQALMRKLSFLYEEVYGLRFTVTNPHEGGPPAGRALDWTRRLFRCFAEGVQCLPAEVVDKHDELVSLAEWAEQPYASADLIRPADRWRQEALKAKRTARASGS